MLNMCFENRYTKVEFEIRDEQLFITSVFFNDKQFVKRVKGIKHSNVFIVGQTYLGKLFHRYALGGEKLQFRGYLQDDFDDRKELIVEEQNDKIYVKTTYVLYHNSGVLQCKKEVKNLTGNDFILECVSPLTLSGVMTDDIEERAEKDQEGDYDPTAFMEETKQTKKQSLPYLWKAHNTWCSEVCFERFDLQSEGLRGMEKTLRCGRIVTMSNGSQTTNRYLPLGILEKENYGFLMFEILPTGSWAYEISSGMGDCAHEWSLGLLGKTLNDNNWYKVLKKDETYETETVRIVGAADLDGIIEHASAIRRNEKRKINSYPHESVIHN